jgi:UDP-glucose 4-epimerase
VDTIVHLAARVHVMNDTAANPLEEFRRVNTHGTERLARAAAEAGVRRLVFISSVKVNGELALPETPFSEVSSPHPVDPYGVSKLEAEESLKRIADATGLEVTIIRPPLIYGPGVAGNFNSLLRLVHRVMPMPFGAIRNRRSMISLTNLVDFIACSINHPGAASETFMVSDGKDRATPELVRHLASGMGRPARLFSMPESAIRALARMTGKESAIDRLWGSLVLDTRKARQMLGWMPPVTAEEELRATALQYVRQRRRRGIEQQ